MDKETKQLIPIIEEQNHILMVERTNDIFERLERIPCIIDDNTYIDFIEWIFNTHGQEKAAFVSRFVFFGFLGNFQKYLAEESNKKEVKG